MHPARSRLRGAEILQKNFPPTIRRQSSLGRLRIVTCNSIPRSRSWEEISRTMFLGTSPHHATECKQCEYRPGRTPREHCALGVLSFIAYRKCPLSNVLYTTTRVTAGSAPIINQIEKKCIVSKLTFCLFPGLFNQAVSRFFRRF